MNVRQSPLIDQAEAHGSSAGKNLPVNPHRVPMDVVADAIERWDVRKPDSVADFQAAE